jgi:hypothetical protein
LLFWSAGRRRNCSRFCVSDNPHTLPFRFRPRSASRIIFWLGIGRRESTHCNLHSLQVPVLCSILGCPTLPAIDTVNSPPRLEKYTLSHPISLTCDPSARGFVSLAITRHNPSLHTSFRNPSIPHTREIVVRISCQTNPASVLRHNSYTPHSNTLTTWKAGNSGADSPR